MEATVEFPDCSPNEQVALQIEQPPYRARIILRNDCTAVEAYQRLRHEHFVRERHWIEENPAHPGMEFDEYDPNCHHLGVFRGTELVGYIRALPWQSVPGFMLEHEFSCLLSEAERSKIRHEQSVELSRLVVRPHACASQNDSQTIIELLLKLLFHLSCRCNWDFYYIVVEPRWLSAFARRFMMPFRIIGQPYEFQNGIQTIAGCADLTELKAAVLQNDPAKYDWYCALP